MPGIQLTDDFRQDEPLGYLVKNFDTTVNEYLTFSHEYQAWNHARNQEQLADDVGEPTDWLVYPLFAGHAIEPE